MEKQHKQKTAKTTAAPLASSDEYCRPCGACSVDHGPMMHCSRCKAAYCSVECQKADWKRHKGECREGADIRMGLVSRTDEGWIPPAIKDRMMQLMEQRHGSAAVAQMQQMRAQVQTQLQTQAAEQMIARLAGDRPIIRINAEMLQSFNAGFSSSGQPTSDPAARAAWEASMQAMLDQARPWTQG